MECVQKDTELIANYHSETRRAVLQQLSVYWRNPLFQPKRKIPTGLKWLLETGEISEQDLKTYESLEGTSLTSLLKPGQLSILLLHKMSDELRFVLIVSLIRKIMQARIETSEMEKNLKILPNLTDEERKIIQEKISQGIPPAWIVADEAQNFLPSERKTTATDILVRLVRERLADYFGVTEKERQQMTPSGIDRKFDNRVKWARLLLCPTKASLIGPFPGEYVPRLESYLVS